MGTSIVVCGGTGNQGGAVVESLIEKGKWNVAALVRDPGSQKAQALNTKGVTLIQGDLLDKASLIHAFQGAHGVFGMTQPWSSDYKKADTQSEVRQGQNIVEACGETNVKHVVFSTVMHFTREKTGVPHVDSKLEIEDYAKKARIPLTLLMPASFMDNIGEEFFPVKRGKVRGFTDGDAKVPYICCRDIGRIAAKTFDEGNAAIGKEINLISDFVSGEELCAILSRIRGGEHFKYSTVPKFFMRIFAKEFYLMRIAFEKYGRPPHPQPLLDALQNCREKYPEILTVEQFLKSRGFDTKQL